MLRKIDVYLCDRRVYVTFHLYGLELLIKALMEFVNVLWNRYATNTIYSGLVIGFLYDCVTWAFFISFLITVVI